MTTPVLPPWRPLLKAAQRREGRSPSARWLQLATVGQNGQPRVRTLVFRAWTEAHQLELFTDTRSQKIKDLDHQPAVEICWLFTKAREQYRFGGVANVIKIDNNRELCQQKWLSLSPSGRAVWGWPSPGEMLNRDATFPEALSDDEPMPDHFSVLRIEIDHVERLHLGPHPHQRSRWQRHQNWRPEELNP
jgi:pyridoxamine 5'-phosphate oxidase